MTHDTRDPLHCPAPPLGDLPLDALDAGGRQVLAWIAELLAHPERVPVLSAVPPGAIAAQLPDAAPADPEPLADILADLDRVILPGITHWNHPGFLAYFANSSSIPSMLGEFVLAGLNTNGMLWATSPVATELEQRVTRWLWDAMGLPDGGAWFGMLTDTASISTMLALAAARERAGVDVRSTGLRAGPQLRVYTSVHAHTSVAKGAITLGLGADNVVAIPVDAQFRMDVDALREAIATDRAAGMQPMAVVATVGTTSTTSVDPVPAIATLCEQQGIWLHVDAAYAGVMGLCAEYRWALDGVARSDSYVTNPHKWLFTTVDCSALFTQHPALLKRAFSLVPEYLVTASDDAVVNYMDYGVQLGRRFRALKLWMVLRAFGTSGLAARLREHCAIAQEFAATVHGAAEWEICAPHPFSLVCFRHVPPGMPHDAVNAHNERIMRAVNARGRVYLSHTKLDGTYVLRLTLGNIRTTREHVAMAWEDLRAAAHL
jgi:aromatic-L-amino-acid/L-tryptophan decarboxylase